MESGCTYSFFVSDGQKIDSSAIRWDNRDNLEKIKFSFLG